MWLRGQLSSYPIRWMSILQLMAFCNEWLTRESRPFLAEEGRRKCLSIFTHFRVLSMFRYILPFRKLGEIHLDVFSTLEQVTMSMHFFLSSMARKGRGVTWPAECPSSHETNPLMVPEIVPAWMTAVHDSDATKRRDEIHSFIQSFILSFTDLFF